MGKIILVTGGSRSGKSLFAQRLAEENSSSKLFIATCPVTDDELAQRIQRHIIDRQHAGWKTVEEEIDIAGQLESASGYETVLIDCLTLWVNNLMFEAHVNNEALDEDSIAANISKVLETACKHPGRVIFVTNEVGLGIVPDNRAARLFRDLVGRCNQCVATAAQDVYLVSCGIPLQIKGNGHAL